MQKIRFSQVRQLEASAAAGGGVKILPTGATITVRETLEVLDGPFLGVSQGIVEGSYAFWLGSGISRERVIGLDGVLAKLVEFLRVHSTTDADCGYRKALEKIIGMANPGTEERAQIDFSRPSSTWPSLQNLLARLWSQYSDVLSVEIPKEKLDYLLWVGLDFTKTFASQEADAEHLAIGMLALEGTVTELATANWDGLLEAAMKELGYPESFYRITVTGEDLRGRRRRRCCTSFMAVHFAQSKTRATTVTSSSHGQRRSLAG